MEIKAENYRRKLGIFDFLHEHVATIQQKPRKKDVQNLILVH